MKNQMDNNHKKVSLEDLLRLKRCERPPAEFWDRFESELRQKQLAALVEDRRPVLNWLKTFVASRQGLASAAIGVVALALFSYNLVHTESKIVAGLEQSHVASVPSDVQVPGVSGDFEPQDFEPISASSEAVAVVANTPQLPAVMTAASGEASNVFLQSETDMPIAGGLLSTGLPSARKTVMIAQIEKVMDRMLASDFDSRFPDSQSPDRSHGSERAHVELASVSISPQGQSSRLLAAYEYQRFVPEPSAPRFVRERIARRLGDSELSDEIRRLDLKGDRVSLKL